MHLRTCALLAVLSFAVLAGCLGGGGSDGPDGDSADRTRGRTAFERVQLPFNVTGDWSRTLVPGPFGILPGAGHFVSIDLPPTEGGAAVFDPLNGPQVHLGLFLPTIPGCHWSAASLPDSCKVPVIADAGPYYRTSNQLNPLGESDTTDTEPATRLGKFLIDNFVPHGYAVAQVSVFGSGDSNHCFDMFGMAEQLGVDGAVTWLGTQPWSNGNVSLIGRSYDGSTPWQSAAFGNPHLKTIVPISGLIGLQSLVTHNGSSEARILLFHNAPTLYGVYGIDGDAGDIQTLCPDYALAVPMGVAALVTGDEVVPLDEGYWREREFFPRTLQNYEGSVFFIHGLQDWNVDPHMISPAFHQLREKGLDVKGLFGQWGHMYPDRPGEHANLDAFPHSVRYDWAEDLKEWFDYYLKGQGLPPVLKVEVQDNIGRWRVEDTYPPVDATFASMAIPGEPAQLSNTDSSATYDLGVVDAANAVTMAGHLYLEAAVTPSGANGQVYFQVNDPDGDGGNGTRLAFGTMDLRYRGGESPVAVPQQELLVRVQSQPFDFVLPAGHRLELVVAQTGEDYLPAPSAAPVTFDPANSQVLLPVIQRTADVYFTPPAWSGTADATAPQP
ncbi:MAG: CocE/NonD family hydrolase [Candidatus Thermoplasmatota archaeon]